MAYTQKEKHFEDSFEPKLEENTSIKLIGLGGVGGIVARYLTIFLA